MTGVFCQVSLTSLYIFLLECHRSLPAPRLFFSFWETSHSPGYWQWLQTMVHNKGDFVSLTQDICQSLETFFVVTTGEGVIGICQVKVREVGKPSTMHTTENYLVLNVSSVKDEKPSGGFHLCLYIGAPGSFRDSRCPGCISDQLNQKCWRWNPNENFLEIPQVIPMRWQGRGPLFY